MQKPINISEELEVDSRYSSSEEQCLYRLSSLAGGFSLQTEAKIGHSVLFVIGGERKQCPLMINPHAGILTQE
jgi:hypothetical protein